MVYNNACDCVILFHTACARNVRKLVFSSPLTNNIQYNIHATHPKQNRTVIQDDRNNSPSRNNNSSKSRIVFDILRRLPCTHNYCHLLLYSRRFTYESAQFSTDSAFIVPPPPPVRRRCALVRPQHLVGSCYYRTL